MRNQLFKNYVIYPCVRALCIITSSPRSVAEGPNEDGLTAGECILIITARVMIKLRDALMPTNLNNYKDLSDFTASKEEPRLVLHTH